MHSFFMTLVIALMTVASLSCVRPLDVDKLGDVAVSLSLSMKNSGNPDYAATKMTGSVTQLGGSFRGIERVYVIPFRKSDANAAVVSTDARLGSRDVVMQIPGIGPGGLVANNNSHLFDIAMMPRGMNRVLAYGKAIDEGDASTKDGKHRNGVLVGSGLDELSVANDISFSLEQIVSADEVASIDMTAKALIDALNGVVEAIRATGEPTFSGIFNYAQGQVWACSHQTFSSIRDNVQTSIFGYSGPGVSGIVSAINELDSEISKAGSTFPSSYGIPEGAIGFWWNGKEFIRLINSVNIALVRMESYCYPPSLWYYANSAILTSDDESVKNEYKPANAKWEDILRHYGDGPAVVSSTRSVAIVDSLQYGTGLLKLSLGTIGVGAADAVGCPITGIVVSEQNDVGFDFFPVPGSESRFVYDNLSSGVSIGGSTDAFIQTLVLQSESGKPVHFALEFQNNTMNVLNCQQGLILPGCKFYLAGELSVGSGRQPEGGEQISSVFCRDHITTVTAKVTSLDKAYNTVPDLRSPQLEIGMLAEMQWIQVSPSSVKLNL